ncbi:DnaA N-terminal domain-containing protein [Neobacillus pocheonensis]|uniref:DnaA N-terminal domain-containing protein n=1 Tax=Neobacillus pocheonensis TaxID=363869 RepID=UPI003D2CAB46
MMNEKFSKGTYKRIDEERIRKALENGRFQDAIVLFSYSVLTKDEFTLLQQTYVSDGPSEMKMKETENDNPQEATVLQNTSPWEQILHFISTKISATSFESWFKQTKGEIDGDVLIISSGDSYQRDWLEERYSMLIWRAAENVLGRAYEVRFTVS